MKSVKNIKSSQLKHWMLLWICAIIPWQTVCIINQSWSGAYVWQFNTLKIYLSEASIYLLFFVLLWEQKHTIRKKIEINKKPAMIILMIASIMIGVSYNVDMTLQAWSWFAAAAVLSYVLIHEKKSIYMIVLATSLSISAILGIAQFASQHVAASSVLGISAQEPLTKGVPVVMYKGQRLLRAFGSMPHPNIFGGYMNLLMFLAVGMYVQTSYKTHAQYAWGLGFVGVLISFSRTAWMMTILLLLILWAHKHTRPVLQIVKKATIILLFLFIIIFFPAIAGRVIPQSRIEHQAIDQRITGIAQSKQIIMRRIWFGTGLHNYTHALKYRFPETPGYALIPIHNTPLLMIIEIGIVPLMLVLYLVRMIKPNLPKKNILISLMLVSPALLFDHYLWSQFSGILMSALVITMSTFLNTNFSQFSSNTHKLSPKK